MGAWIHLHTFCETVWTEERETFARPSLLGRVENKEVDAQPARMSMDFFGARNWENGMEMRPVFFSRPTTIIPPTCSPLSLFLL